MKTFLGVGEAMVELSREGPGLLRRGFAGDVLNTLWYARARLGGDWRARFFTALGEDPLSDEMIEFAEGGGVLCDRVLRVPGRLPGIYMIHLRDGERSFDYWRGESAARLMCRDPAPLRAAIAEADLVYLSGVTLAILPPQDAETMLEAVADRGEALCAFDPNIRPRLWNEADRMRRMITAAAAAADIALPSFDDEAAAFSDASPEATAERYAKAGCGHVVVKNGPGPVTVLNGGRLERIPAAPAPPPVDTTAAGDAFNAAYLASFLAHGDVAAAAAEGCRLARAVIARRGAIVDLPPDWRG